MWENKNPRNSTTFRAPSGLHTIHELVYTVRKRKKQNVSYNKRVTELQSRAKSLQWAYTALRLIKSAVRHG